MDAKTIKKNINSICRVILDAFHQTHYTTAQITYLQPNNRLKGKRIIITGGGRGLGYDMAKKFVSEGATVLISGRNESVLQRAANEIKCHYICFDISNFERIPNFIGDAANKMGGIDCLVNNAGISLHEGDIRNVTEKGFDDQFDINLKAGYFLSQQFIKYFEVNKCTNGSILFLSSERGQYVDDIPYGLIKAAVNSLTQGLSKALIHNGIRVNAVAPGITATEMTGRSADNLYSKTYSTGRFYLPGEVSEIACFLLSDAASCLSGQVLVCNNGYSVNSYK